MELFHFILCLNICHLNALVGGHFFFLPASFFFIFLHVGIDVVATAMYSHMPATQGYFPSVLVSILPRARSLVSGLDSTSHVRFRAGQRQKPLLFLLQSKANIHFSKQLMRLL